MIEKRTFYAVIVLSIIIAGCGIFIQPDATDAAAVEAYNKQVREFLAPFVTAIVSAIGVLILWVQSNLNRNRLAADAKIASAELAEKAEKAAKMLVEETQATARLLVDKTEDTARLLAEKADKRTEHVIEEVKEAKKANLNALSAANNFNEKLLKAQIDRPMRAPSRTTDKGDGVQKVEITSGPGVETPLVVEEKHQDKPR